MFYLASGLFVNPHYIPKNPGFKSLKSFESTPKKMEDLFGETHEWACSDKPEGAWQIVDLEGRYILNLRNTGEVGEENETTTFEIFGCSFSKDEAEDLFRFIHRKVHPLEEEVSRRIHESYYLSLYTDHEEGFFQKLWDEMEWMRIPTLIESARELCETHLEGEESPEALEEFQFGALRAYHRNDFANGVIYDREKYAGPHQNGLLSLWEKIDAKFFDLLREKDRFHLVDEVMSVLRINAFLQIYRIRSSEALGYTMLYHIETETMEEQLRKLIKDFGMKFAELTTHLYRHFDTLLISGGEEVHGVQTYDGLFIWSPEEFQFKATELGNNIQLTWLRLNGFRI